MQKNKIIIGIIAFMVLLSFSTFPAAAVGGEEGWIKIVCNVAGATVYFDGQSQGTMSGTEQSFSVYSTSTPIQTIKVTKYGYYDFSTSSVRMPSAGETVTVYATLNPIPTQTPSTGSLYVTSSPSGAEVYLNGYYEGKTPCTITNQNPGTYNIKVSKDGYKDYTGSVSVTANQRSDYSYTLSQNPTPGYVTITSSPSGAYIYMDGAYKGKTPMTISGIAPATHTIELDLSGYYDWKTTVSINPGSNTPISATLSPLPDTPGYIHVASSPSGASIYLDGSYRNAVTPATLSNIAVGTHTMTLKLAGYNDYTTSVEVRSSTTSYVNAQLTPGTTPSSVGVLSIETTPGGANVYVDNVYSGISPLSGLSVASGSHVVTAKLTGYNDASQTVTVNQGQSTQVSLSLSPVQASPGFGVVLAILGAGICAALFLARRD